MPFDAEEQIIKPLADFLRNTKRASEIMVILGIEDIGNNASSVLYLIESAPKNSSDEELIDHIAKHIQTDYQPEAPSFILLDQ